MLTSLHVIPCAWQLQESSKLTHCQSSSNGCQTLVCCVWINIRTSSCCRFPTILSDLYYVSGRVCLTGVVCPCRILTGGQVCVLSFSDKSGMSTTTLSSVLSCFLSSPGKDLGSEDDFFAVNVKAKLICLLA